MVMVYLLLVHHWKGVAFVADIAVQECIELIVNLETTIQYWRRKSQPVFLLLHHCVHVAHYCTTSVWWWWWWPDPSPPRSEWVPGQAPRAGTNPGKKVTPAQPRAAQRAVRVVGPRQRSCEHSDIRQHVTVTTTTNVPDLTSEDSSRDNSCQQTFAKFNSAQRRHPSGPSPCSLLKAPTSTSTNKKLSTHCSKQ